MHLYLAPWGDVRACCQQQRSLGIIPGQRLGDIWAGAVRRDLVDRLAREDFSAGCESCADEIAQEGREASYAAVFDPLPTAPEGRWPTHIEFNLSNRCNLQCIQCNPTLSSTIRAKQTDLPPIQGVYGDEFFADLLPFLPHLEAVQFAGGEPFLADENYRAWELLADHAPGIRCATVTNATVWTPRVEAVLERLPMDIVVSLDGISAQTFEAIRLGASLDRVLRNLDRFHEYTRRVGTTLSINHCLMVQNHGEFGALLLFAEQRAIPVNISVVRGPEACAISCLPDDRLVEVARALLAQDAAVGPQLVLNRAVWERELDRIAAWARLDDADRQQAFARTAYADQLMGFRRTGAEGGSTDPASARARLGVDGPVHEVDFDADERIASLSPGLLRLLGLEAESLVGRAPADLASAVMQALGTLLEQHIEEGDDLTEVRMRFPAYRVHTVLFPVRDGRGRASAVRMLISVGAA